MPLDVTTYREQLEQMTADVLEEQYQHMAGHKPTLEVSPIYERYAELGTLEQARAMAGGAFPTELFRHSCETYVAGGLKDLTEQVANAEATLTVRCDGEDVPYRAVRSRLMNEPDRSRRLDLHHRRCEVTERDLNPLLREAAERERELVRDLDATTVLELYQRFGYDPGELHVATSAFLADTEDLYRERMDEELRRRVGVSLDEATPADTNRMLRAPEFDAGFATDRAVPALRATLAELGIQLDAQRNVVLDVDERPGKVPRAFCAPVRVPGRVVLVVLPHGGQDDYRALFHEAGHTEHFACTSAELPAEDRLLGDNAVTEGFAFLFEHLTSSRDWLRSRLDFGPIEDFVRFQALMKLFIIRRYAAKLAYELELNGGGSLDAMGGRYAQLLGDATGIAYPVADHLEDVDGGFYCTCYLRAWAFEAQLGDHLRDRFGVDWFRRRQAGSLLRELWELGQSVNAGALLRDVTGQTLSFGVLADEAHAALA